MPPIFVTLDTSHSEMSPLNDVDEAGTRHAWNNILMSVTAETSQDPIGPCSPLEQSVGDSSKHRTMAALSSVLDSGAHPAMAVKDCDQGTH